MVSKESVRPDLPFYPVRFRLRKDGALQYISHLDFVRTMQKMLVRSGLPLWYTQGFNPIPKFSFAAPLSVGTESDCELMDVRLSEPMDPAAAAEKLTAIFPPHLEVLDAYVPTAKFCDIGYISYDFVCAYEGICAEHAERATAFLSTPEILVEKKGKAGLRTVDIKPLIASARLTYDGEREEIRGRFILSAAPASFLGTESLVAALRAGSPILPESALCYYSFRRREVYGPDLKPFR